MSYKWSPKKKVHWTYQLGPYVIKGRVPKLEEVMTLDKEGQAYHEAVQKAWKAYGEYVKDYPLPPKDDPDYEEKVRELPPFQMSLPSVSYEEMVPILRLFRGLITEVDGIDEDWSSLDEDEREDFVQVVITPSSLFGLYTEITTTYLGFHQQ
jgi:hypothetical protein